MKNDKESIVLPLAISIVGHLVLIMFFFYSPSWLFRKFPEEQIIVLEMLPVTDTTNVKTQKAQKEKTIEAEESKKVQKTKDIEKPQEELKEEEKRPAQKEPKPEEKSVEQDKKDVEKIPEKKEEPKKKPPEKPKPQKKKKVSEEVELESLLKTLEKASDGKNQKSKNKSRTEQADADKESKGPFDVESPLSISEYQAIKQQIERHWNVPVGARNASDMKVTLYIRLSAEGTVEQVKLVDQKCPPGSDIVCQAAADGALRAVGLASPFQGLSSNRYDSWKEFNIEFDPSEIAG